MGPAGGGAACVKFMRGDSSGDRTLDITDAIFSLNYLFLAGAAPGCLYAADTNDDGANDITDPIHTLWYIFAGGPVPPFPLTLCGDDYTKDQLACISYPDCGATTCGCFLPPFKELFASSIPTSFNSEKMASKDVQIADLDGDGDLDCFVPESRGGPCQPDHVYLNRINEVPSKIEPRGDLTNTAGGDFDGMGNWGLLMSQNSICFPWTHDCNTEPAPECAAFETTYASVIVDVGSPSGGGPDGKKDIITIGGSDFMRVLINLGTNPPTFEDQSGKLEFDPNAGPNGGWKPMAGDPTKRIYHSVTAPLGSGLPADKNPIDLLGPLVTDVNKFIVNQTSLRLPQSSGTERHEDRA